MLTKIQIEENSGWVRYKSDEPIKPGPYFTYLARLSAEDKERFKQQLAPIAAQDGAGRFSWLLPYERWVKCVMDSFIPPELHMYGQVVDSPASRRELVQFLDISMESVNGLRDWQRGFLYDYLYSVEQREGYRRGAIVPLGGGKTLAGLCIAKAHKAPIVLAPSYLHGEWQREADKWGFKCPTVSTYESAHKHIDGEHDFVILDEALLVSNPHTQRHGNALELSTRAKGCIGLTGTPQSVSPMDLRWLRVVFPGCVPRDEKPWRYLFGLDTVLKEVKPGQQAYVTTKWDQVRVDKFCSPYTLVVDRNEIAKDLPEITYNVLTTPTPKSYELILRGAATETNKSKALAQARQCTDGRIIGDNGNAIRINTDKLDLVEQFVASLGEPCILFAHWQFMVDDLSERLADYRPAVLAGGMDYTGEIQRFVRGETGLLIANSCISSGMNLQERARVIVFVSNSSRPVDRAQGIGRVYRPGQRRAVLVYDIIADNTLDGVQLELLNKHTGKSEAFIEAALKREFNKRCKA